MFRLTIKLRVFRSKISLLCRQEAFINKIVKKNTHIFEGCYFFKLSNLPSFYFNVCKPFVFLTKNKFNVL